MPYVSPVPRTRVVLRNSCCSRWTVVSRTYFEAGFAFPVRPQSWDRLGHLNVAFKAEGSPHRAVAFPQLPVGGFVATRLGEEGTQPQHRELSRF